MFDVITIGTITRDIFLKSEFFKVLRDPQHLKKIGFKTGEAECFALGSKLEVDELVSTMGGGAANAAITFSRQGFKTSSLFRIGDDEEGELLIRELKKEKVSPLVVKDKKERTAYSTILLTPGGERTILIYRGAASKFEKKEIPFSKFRASWAYISPGDISVSLMQLIIDDLKKKNIKIAMNPSKRYIELGAAKLKPILKGLNAVILNREEASCIAGLDYGHERKIFKKLDEIVDGIAVMTDGSNGAVVSDGKYLYRSGVFHEKKLIDRTGAGDAFGSGFVSGLMTKNDIYFALRLASANAASVVENIGAQTGILSKKDFQDKRWQYLDLDVDPL